VKAGHGGFIHHFYTSTFIIIQRCKIY